MQACIIAEGREAVAELLASGAEIVMLEEVELNGPWIDEVLRLELCAYDALKLATCEWQSRNVQYVCKWQVAWESGVEDVQTEAIVLDEGGMYCVIDHLWSS